MSIFWTRSRQKGDSSCSSVQIKVLSLIDVIEGDAKLLLKKPAPLIELEEWIWKRNIDDLARAAQGGFPHLLLSAGSGPANVREGGSVIQILTESKAVDFPEASHGWVNRGDIKVATARRDVKRALELSFVFFDEILQ